MSEVSLKKIGKRYGQLQVLSDIDLDIETGELIVFVGPSGCGKSTLLRMIAGLEKISDGELRIEGQRVNETPPAKRGIAMVFQSYALYPHMSVRQNMGFALELAKTPKAEIAKRVEDAAEMLQLAPYLERLPKALSGGQRQRVAIGRAIVRDPKVFLFDEPLSNLDAALRGSTRLEIAALKARMPEATMIYVTHDQIEAMTLADRIVVLNGGGIEQVGTPMELYHRPQNEFVAQFIGAPAMNLMEGVAGDADTNGRLGVTLSNGQKITTHLPSGILPAHTKVRLGIRPEHLQLAPTPETAILSGRLMMVEALGEVTNLHVDIFGDTAPLVIAKTAASELPEIGATIHLEADATNLHLFAAGKRIDLEMAAE